MLLLMKKFGMWSSTFKLKFSELTGLSKLLESNQADIMHTWFRLIEFQ